MHRCHAGHASSCSRPGRVNHVVHICLQRRPSSAASRSYLHNASCPRCVRQDLTRFPAAQTGLAGSKNPRDELSSALPGPSEGAQ